MTHKRWYPLLVATVAATACMSAGAQNYPVRSIRLLVGFQPGGAVDISARTLGAKLSDSIGQSVVVDNRSGAAGNIAADVVAKAAPDGYTLLMCNTTLATPSLFDKLPFDVSKDLAPVSLVAIGPSVLVVHPSVPVKTVKELIAAARAKPDSITYGSGGTGNITHLEMVLFNHMTNTKMTHVPYKGGAPSVVGLLSGEVQALFTSIPSILPQIQAGKVRTLAVSTAKRNSALPDVPTVAEAGVPGYDAASWYGVLAPAGMPRDISTKLAREIQRIMNLPDVKSKFLADGFEPSGSTPEEFKKFMDAEVPKWSSVIKSAGIKAE